MLPDPVRFSVRFFLSYGHSYLPGPVAPCGERERQDYFLLRLAEKCAIQKHTRSNETRRSKHKKDQDHPDLVSIFTKLEYPPS